MSLSALESTINSAFDAREGISTATRGEVREAVDHALDLLDKGEARVAMREASGKWKVNQWLKKAVLLSFRLNDMSAISGGPGKASWWDKVPSKFEGWGENRFRDAGFRAVPGALPGRPLKNGEPGPATACAVIVKRVDERTRAKTSINELLRDQ